MSAPNVRKFTVGQVMTVLAGDAERVFCSWGEVLDVLGWLLQDVPMAEELGEAIAEARPGVARQHPGLVAYSAPPVGASDSHVLGWLADIEASHAPLLELVPVDDEEAEQ